MRVRHEAMHKILATLTLTSACVILVILSRARWKCYPTVFSYYCDTSEGKDVSRVKHRDTAFLCIRGLDKKQDIPNLRRGKRQLEVKLKVVYKSHKSFRDVPEALSRKEM